MRVGFTFPAGRYHATPWGCHVNEGAVEWPPSPWRLVRTLVATGYAKLGWSEVPALGQVLIEALARQLPRYWLSPEVTTGHTRHYMPDGAVAKLDPKKGVWNRSTDLVPWRQRFDPLVACGRSDVLIYRCHGARTIYRTGSE